MYELTFQAQYTLFYVNRIYVYVLVLFYGQLCPLQTRPILKSAHFKVTPLQSEYENISLIFIFMYKIRNHSILCDFLAICYRNAAWRSSMLPGNVYLAEELTFQFCGLTQFIYFHVYTKI